MRVVCLVVTAAVVAGLNPVTASAATQQGAVVARTLKSVVVVHAGDREGTAFAFGASGQYLTNAHVVGSSGVVTLVGPDGQAQQAQIASLDPDSDVALLRSQLALPPLPAASGPPSPGDPVLTVGTPDGLGGTVSSGIVSAVGRRIGSVPMIQIDVAVNPGNSGGPLLSQDGKVLGVVSDKARGQEGIGFAIPIAVAQRAASHRLPHTPSSGLGSGALAAIAALAAAALALLVILTRRLRRVPEPPEPVRVRRTLRPAEEEEPLIVIRRSSRRS